MILGMFIVTYIPRVLPLIALQKEIISKIESWLKYIPTATFSSIISMNLLGFTTFGQTELIKLFTALICLITAVKTKKLIMTMIVGLIVYIAISLLIV